MRKNYFFAPEENFEVGGIHHTGWIVDRFKKEWDRDPENNSVPGVEVGSPTQRTIRMSYDEIKEIEVVWINAEWCWRQFWENFPHFHMKKFLVTIHHIVENKFGWQERNEFKIRDKFVTAYHVYNEHVLNFVRELTNKPIHMIPYWFDQSSFQSSILNKQELRLKHGLPLDAFIVGSAQRDTEGASIQSGKFLPKYEKGPDLFCDAVEKLKITEPNIHVLLGGWRRQYIIRRLNAAGIPFSYFEMPRQEKLNELLQSIDLYIVASRCEGGPQSILECSALNVPVVSRPIGIASQCLPQSAINDDVTQAIPAIPKIAECMKLPYGYEPYRRLIQSL